MNTVVDKETVTVTQAIQAERDAVVAWLRNQAPDIAIAMNGTPLPDATFNMNNPNHVLLVATTGITQGKHLNLDSLQLDFNDRTDIADAVWVERITITTWLMDEAPHLPFPVNDPTDILYTIAYNIACGKHDKV